MHDPDDHDHPHGPAHDHSGTPERRFTGLYGVEDVDIAAEIAADAKARTERRRPYSGFDNNDLEAAHEAAWDARVKATNDVLALTEELLARLVARQIPNAASIILVEDLSHGSPHGHLHSILDAGGGVLFEGLTDTWHDLDWTGEADELIWDIHHLAGEAFNPLPDVPDYRARILPITLPT